MSIFVKAVENRFQLTTGVIYPVIQSCLRDDGNLSRDAGGLVAAGAAIWCDQDGQPVVRPAAIQQDGQHYAGVYDTEIPLLAAFARMKGLPLAVLVHDGNIVVNFTASPWIGPILLDARAGIRKAMDMLTPPGATHAP